MIDIFSKYKKKKTQRVIQDLVEKNKKLKGDLLDSELTIELKVKKLDDLIAEIQVSKDMLDEAFIEVEEARKGYEASKHEFDLMKINYEKEVKKLIKNITKEV